MKRLLVSLSALSLLVAAFAAYGTEESTWGQIKENLKAKPSAKSANAAFQFTDIFEGFDAIPGVDADGNFPLGGDGFPCTGERCGAFDESLWDEDPAVVRDVANHGGNLVLIITGQVENRSGKAATFKYENTGLRLGEFVPEVIAYLFPDAPAGAFVITKDWHYTVSAPKKDGLANGKLVATFNHNTLEVVFP